MLRPDYPLRTERLDLRPLHPSDVDAVLAYASHPDVARYVLYPPQTRAQIVERLAGADALTSIAEPGDGLDLAIVRRDTGALIGDVALEWTSEEHSRAALGYALHPDHHGRGYGSEAAREMLRVAFDELGVHKATAKVDSRNAASAALLERVGMRCEARRPGHEWFKGEWVTVVEYGLLADDWRSARAAAGSGQRGGQVGDQIVGILDADR